MPMTFIDAYVKPNESVYVRQGEYLVNTFIHSANSNGKPEIVQNLGMSTSTPELDYHSITPIID